MSMDDTWMLNYMSATLLWKANTTKGDDSEGQSGNSNSQYIYIQSYTYMIICVKHYIKQSSI